jgi:hypothetical protein
MANLTVALNILTSDAFTDSPTQVNNTATYISAKDSVLKRILLTADTGKLIFDSSEYGRSFLYLKFISGGDSINIEDSGSSTIYASLQKNEFVFIPWHGTVDLYAESVAAAGVIEVGIFED